MNFCKISLKPIPKATKHAGYLDTEFRALFGSIKVNPVLPFSRAEFLQDSVKHIKGMSISGVQQKLSLGIDDNNELIPVSKSGAYILKPSPEEFPNAAENEHAAMVSSALLGIETAQCGLVNFTDGELAYITKRFDRVEDGSKLPQEDLLQGFDIASEGKYDRSYESAGKLILEITTGKMAVVLDFFTRVIHAYMIGNSDMHLKNISLHKNIDNTSRYYDKLTPNYDSLLTDVFKSPDGNGFLALDLFEGDFSEEYQHYGYYTGNDFITLGNRLGLTKNLVKKTILAVIAKKDAILDVVKRSYMPDDMKARAEELIGQRSRALGAGILD
jgi:serine/threonine-protein kinase HipA